MKGFIDSGFPAGEFGSWRERKGVLSSREIIPNISNRAALMAVTGGDGGDVLFGVAKHLSSFNALDPYKNKVMQAMNGQDGMGSKKHGKRGRDLLIKVPLGTVIKDVQWPCLT